MKDLRFCSASGNPAGFTLVEVIASLMIMGILAALLGMGIGQVVQGYMASRENADIALKGQVALARIMKELRSLDSVTAANQRSITYSYNRDGDGVLVVGRSLVWSGTDGTDLMLDGNVLTNDVNNFTLAYLNDYTHAGDSSWDGAETLIRITLTLNGSLNDTVTFTGQVRPRNL